MTTFEKCKKHDIAIKGFIRKVNEKSIARYAMIYLKTISTCGIEFRYSKDLEINSLCDIKLNLYDTEEFELTIKILKKEKEGNKYFNYYAEFIGLSVNEYHKLQAIEILDFIHDING